MKAGRQCGWRALGCKVALTLPLCLPLCLPLTLPLFWLPLPVLAQADLVRAPGAPTPPLSLSALQSVLDGLSQRGMDEPDGALAVLAAQRADTPTEKRLLALTRGLVAAGAGRTAAAAEAIAALLALSASDVLATADAAAVQATLADLQGEPALVLEAARAALQVYDRVCPAAPGCDYRSLWRMRMMSARRAEGRGEPGAAHEHALAAAELARSAADPLRQAWALGQAADISGSHGDPAAAQRLLGQAQRLVRLEGSRLALSRLRLFETRSLVRNQDTAGAVRAAESGRQLARDAGSPRLMASHLANLSDLAVRDGRPRDALAAVQQALPIARRHGDQRAERVLMHNAALARIALGQTAAARQTLQDLLAAHRTTGASADEAEALREFGAAFAAAGDIKSALALYHQERKLAAEMMAANRDAALAALRARFDREAQQRQLQQLGQESTLMSAQLANRATLQKVWAAGALLLLLAAVLVALFYRRVRTINRSLAHNHAFLRAQSQRDPLTGLANRRGLHEAVQADGLTEQFSGALLLVDIDHFKHVNDGHGHAAGDAVLVEVARRLATAVRDNDLVVRWGGEEFLIYMRGAGGPQAQAQALALAERVLQAVAGQAVPLPGAGTAAGTLRVTVSVGYGSFPLPPARLPLTLERATNLADMALYTAKGLGRNRAIGITAARADEDGALRGIEADFDQAWHEGRLTLQPTPGPAAPEPLPGVARVSEPA